MSAIWEVCNGRQHIQPLEFEAIRVVESQHISSTRKLVDTTKEHEILEELIEHSKPPLDFEKAFHKCHYLLFTPFRYPPLKHGSRFGHRFERSLWYGSLEIETALAEVAFYRLYFLQGTSAELGVVEAGLTAFVAHIKTRNGINLKMEPFVKHQSQISSPIQYSESQTLGTRMREEGVEAFVYQSARKEAGGNLGVFTPKAFKLKHPKPGSFQSWQSIATHQGVEFLTLEPIKKQKLTFPIDYFLIDGQFPLPPM